jgi:hypothetical protein
VPMTWYAMWRSPLLAGLIDLVRRTRTLTGRGERTRASGPVQRVVRQPLGPAGGDRNRPRCRRTPVQSLGANAWHSDALRRQRSPASPWRASPASSASPGGPR